MAVWLFTQTGDIKGRQHSTALLNDIQIGMYIHKLICANPAHGKWADIQGKHTK